MINKKKVLFYGNCQLSVLSKMLQSQNPKFNEQYEVLKASDYKLPHIWFQEVGTVAPFMYSEHTKYGVATLESIKAVERITEDADIIIFQKFHEAKHANRPEELTTDYIYTKHNTCKKMICIPSFWFSGYLTEALDDLVIPSIFKWLVDKKLNNKQILDWLKNESHPNISLLIEKNAKDSIEELYKREIEETYIYKNFVSILDILPEYKKIFLCYTMSHPSKYYFKKLYKEIIKLIDIELYHDITDENILIPSACHFPFPLDFYWFNENFPNISNCDPKEYVERLDEKFVYKQVSLVTAIDTESHIFKNHIQRDLNILNKYE